MRSAVCLAFALVSSCLFASAPTALKVSANQRYLVDEQGEPFFYLADTAWELFHRLDEKDAEAYLAARAEQGFTVIQCVILAECDGLRIPNANGDLPLVGNDPGKPNEAYFKHVDRIIDRMKNTGLWRGFSPRGAINGIRLGAKGPSFSRPKTHAHTANS